jgi:sucrose phosphorylase
MSDTKSADQKEMEGRVARHGNTATVHNPEPDYHRPLLEIPPEAKQRMLDRLTFLYGEEVANAWLPELERVLKVYYAHKPKRLMEREKNLVPEERFTEKDAVLITYGDLVRKEGESPLKTLVRLCDTMLAGVNTVHILPFFPSSSDRGFSIIDFEVVDPNLGTWEDIEGLDARVQLMFDAVFNHVSSKSRYFQEFLNGDPYFKDLFISYRSRDELTPEQRERIRRPRTSDILTEFQSIDGPVYVWTTFSPDQVDVNFKNPDALIRILEVLLMYIRRGADILRLDAVTYLWAEPGTSCASLEETHEIIKLFRDAVDLVAPGVALITETNVPHEENISYFGNGDDEAHMVYNFALPPLVLHTFYTEDTTALSDWAKDLETPSKTTHLFNFLDSHDGFGVMGVKDILSQEAIDDMINRAEEHGGMISYRTDRDGKESPYEINITLFSALNREDSGEDMDLQIKRLLAARNISLVLQGVPAAYLLGLIGKRNDVEAALATRSKRAINRTVLDYELLMQSFEDPQNKLYRIRELGGLVRIRQNHRAFHPNGPQKILMVSPNIFAVLRESPEGDEHILTLTNVANRICEIEIPLDEVGVRDTRWYDLIRGSEWSADAEKLPIRLEPYEVLWLKPSSERHMDPVS